MEMSPLADTAGRIIAALRESGAESIARLLADDIVMELPFHPAGALRLEGRDAVLKALASLGALFRRFRLNAHEIRVCGAQQTVIVEATGFGLAAGDGAVYQNRYVFLFTLRDDRVCRWREYLNPYPVMGLSAPPTT
ncbi:nuclear transport factor 2 family protein [Sinimarinibacterium flocculans]|uniref:nuclear transport factor 2 family protein n=1 Tax=Sinimarinibacterium flocculans TaxID=985250 RepID=UPI002493671C|nr:nuclear transport factor 2 family protein [Sinimarinibacterium flocculans]